MLTFSASCFEYKCRWLLQLCRALMRTQLEYCVSIGSCFLIGKTGKGLPGWLQGWWVWPGPILKFTGSILKLRRIILQYENGSGIQNQRVTFQRRFAFQNRDKDFFTQKIIYLEFCIGTHLPGILKIEVDFWNEENQEMLELAQKNGAGWLDWKLNPFFYLCSLNEDV